MNSQRKKDPAPESEDVVLLEDLAPMRDVRGGAGRLRFGQSLPPSADAHLPNEETAGPSVTEARPTRRGR